MKKIISSVVAVVMAVLVFCSTSVMAFADTTEHNASVITHSDVSFENKIPTYASASGVGGISVGTSNNRLFTLKANDEKFQVSVLYYYSNLYSSAAPKKIVFKDNLLGHANGMSLDDNYLYITGWQISKDSNVKTRIMRVSRSAIAAMSDKEEVKLSDSSSTTNINVNMTIKGKKYNVLKEIKPLKQDGSLYKGSITAITRLNYNKTNANDPIVKFIIDYDLSKSSLSLPYNNSEGLMYTVATLRNGQITVSEDENDMFFVRTNDVLYRENGTGFLQTLSYNTRQDIFYEPGYGLYIPVWNTQVRAKSIVLRVDMTPFNSSHSGVMELTPSTVTVFDFSAYCTKFEIESIAFVKKESDKTTACKKFIFGANIEGTNNGSNLGDRYFILKNTKNLLSNF